MFVCFTPTSAFETFSKLVWCNPSPFRLPQPLTYRWFGPRWGHKNKPSVYIKAGALIGSVQRGRTAGVRILLIEGIRTHTFVRCDWNRRLRRWIISFKFRGELDNFFELSWCHYYVLLLIDKLDLTMSRKNQLYKFFSGGICPLFAVILYVIKRNYNSININCIVQLGSIADW